MNIAFNEDDVPGNGIGGSAVFHTRELPAHSATVEKCRYKYTFNEEAVGKVRDLVSDMEDKGVKTVTSQGIDNAFRAAFFW